MPQGVEHRYASPCKLKPVKGLLTSDAVRRWTVFRVKLTSSEKLVLDSWRTENVTLGGFTWDGCRQSRTCMIKHVSWGKRLIAMDSEMMSSGIVSIKLRAEFKIWHGLKRITECCSVKSVAISILENLSNTS
jgi:hypothetical protein